MRTLRTLLVVAGGLGLGPAGAIGQGAKPDINQQILNLRPAVKGIVVEYDTPPDADAVAACKTENPVSPPGFLLRDAQGRILRRFVDVVPEKGLDQWSYYQDGFEVYREVDLDGDKSVDEARWMNAAGTRTALVKNNAIVGWKRISAEEASKVLVHALVTGDLALLESVMASPDELAALGVPGAEVARAKAGAAGRAVAVAALRKGLAGWDKSTAWLRTDAAMPHAIPADASAGLKGDLTLYENAVIFAGSPKEGPGDKTAFLQASEIVKVGETWKFVELPRAINPANNAPVVAVEGGIRTAIYREAGPGGPAEDPAVAKATKALADFDAANGANLDPADKPGIARFHVDRIPLLRAIANVAAKPEDKLLYDKQAIDSLAAAYQSGKFPAGLKVLKDMEEKGGKLGSYAAYRRVMAVYALSSDEPNANVVAVQKAWMADLKAFLDTHGKGDEAPEVLLALASNNELNAEETEAREYYTKLAEGYPEAEPGKKAAGALRRLDLVGKPIVLKGKGTDGKPIDAAQYRGKTLLISFWAKWAGPAQRDLPEVAKVYEKNKAKGFEVVGVCLDNDKADLDAFLKATPLPWAQVFEPGGMESRLAVEFGIISLPTMILVDPDGKVINRNIRSAADLDIQLDKALAGKQAGVALGVK